MGIVDQNGMTARGRDIKMTPMNNKAKGVTKPREHHGKGLEEANGMINR